MLQSLLGSVQGTLAPVAGVADRLRLTFQNLLLNLDDLNPSALRETFAVVAQAAAIVIDTTVGYTVVPFTTNAVWTVNAPAAVVGGRLISICIRNVSGGALGAATWTGGAGGFRLAGAWVNPANNTMRVISFRGDTTNNIWTEVARNAADVPV